MKHSKTSKVVAGILCVMMLLSMLPLSAFAANNYDETVSDFYNLVSKQDWEISPGVTESNIVLNNDAGTRRQVLHVMEVDVNNPYASVMTSYTGMQPNTFITPDKYATSGMTVHAADIEKNFGYNVVGGMNCCLSWYNTGTYVTTETWRVNEPLGIMVVDGFLMYDKNHGFPTCLVINKDTNEQGETRPAEMPKVQMKTIASTDDLTGWEEQVIPTSSGYIVKDGVNQSSKSHTGGEDPRSVVGIKADGTVVFVMNDGRQAPYSLGMNMYELGEMMISLGCTWAVNCDGGGSSTFLSQRPGEDLKVNCSLSEGAQRPNTSGIMVISSAPSNGEFVRAHVDADNDYVTPNSTVQFTAIGADLAGGAAEIPAGAYWKLEDETVGSIDGNGLFTSNGTLGKVTAQLIFNEEVVGSATANVVIPDKLAFSMENITVPFGKSIGLVVSAQYGAKEITLKDGDLRFTLSDNAVGTIVGNVFTAAGATEITNAIVTVKFGDTDISAQANIMLGRGSEVLFDFEDQDLSSFCAASQHAARNLSNIYIADATTGKVHDGNYSMAFHVDFSETDDWGGVQRTDIRYIGEDISLEGAVGIGMWVYIPDETVGMKCRFWINNAEMDPKDICGQDVEESGWKYLYFDLTSVTNPVLSADASHPVVAGGLSYQSRFFQSVLQYAFDKPYDKSINTDVTYYIDSITVDYSAAVDDREEPVFGTITCIANDMSGATANLQKGAIPSISADSVSFSAAVAENTVKSNYTGIVANSAKAFIDGNAIACVYANGTINTENVSLSAGKHTLKLYISDAMGNTAVVVRKINIQANSDASTVKLVPHDLSIEKALCGSLYYVDVVATDIETVKAVDMVIDLNNVNDWELQGMEVTNEFVATYSMDEIEHSATVHFERTGDIDATGEFVIASLPIRVWWCEDRPAGVMYTKETFEDLSKPLVTPEQLWASKTLWPMDIKVDVDYGKITYVDSYQSDVLGFFSGDQIVTDTEKYYCRETSATVTGIALFDATDWASKTRWHEHNAQPMEDKTPTCTEAGYTGRTFCAGCNSVVDWGTPIPATGHTYELVEGKFVCDCGDEYKPGTGLFEMNGNWYYAINNTLVTGWQMIDNEWYYFDATTFTSVESLMENAGTVKYSFEKNGKLTDGVWCSDGIGTRYWYGPGYYSATYNVWATINGYDYCFGRNGYRFEGIHSVFNRVDNIMEWYVFDDEGRKVEKYFGTGFLTEKENDDISYVVDGISATGMICVDGSYYYCPESNHCYCVRNIERYCHDNHNLLPAGYYTFGNDGKMLDHVVYNNNGVLTYYVSGKISNGTEMATIAGVNYTVDANGVVDFTGTCIDASGAELYYINGIEQYVPKNGLVIKDGIIAYYDNDVAIYAGVVTDGNGNYYYINSTLRGVKNCSYYIGKTNGLIEEGQYQIAEDGKIINPILKG